MFNVLNELNCVLAGLKIKAKCVNVRFHRHIVFCDLHLEPGQRIAKIERSAREIGLALKAKTVPIVTLDSQNGVVSIQFAISEASIINFSDLYSNYSAPNGILPFLLGESSDGQPMWVDMAMNPHMLIAGGTGSGKTTLVHTLIANVMKRDDVWLYLSDPKGGVEFGIYDNSLVNYCATDYENTLYMLDELYEEMERRYLFFRNVGISSIEQSPHILPKILVMIDEVADLMLQDQNKRNPSKGRFEHVLCSIAQKSRASGIYLVLSTQRPSVDVITGLIKANFPARIACKVSSGVDSKIILDQLGAESLLGRGDAIINSSKYRNTRFQVAYSDPKTNYVN